MAVFRVEPTEQGLSINVNFDKEDYATVHELASEQIDRYHLQHYLDCSTDWVINGTQQQLLVSSVEVKGDHIQAHCQVKLASTDLNRIAISNEFLLDVDDQTNVVLLVINGNTSKKVGNHVFYGKTYDTPGHTDHRHNTSNRLIKDNPYYPHQR